MNDSSQEQLDLLDRKRRIRRNAVLLALTAVAFYVAYIVLSLK